jgi:hypothetical protein
MVRSLSAVAVVIAILGAVLGTAGCTDGAPPALPAARPGAAAITIVSTPPGAAITVNGIAVGQAPVTVTLNVGPQRLRAAMSGYYPAPETPIVVERGVAATHELFLVASH